jgi:hypothetical protein
MDLSGSVIEGSISTVLAVGMHMNAQLIGHVFATLQSLEKCMANVKKMIPGQEASCPEITKIVPEQERVLLQMRRMANMLQLETARNDWPSAVRSLKIFYGLNHMIRNDLMTAFTKLSQQQTVHTAQYAPVGKHVMYH